MVSKRKRKGKMRELLRTADMHSRVNGHAQPMLLYMYCTLFRISGYLFRKVSRTAAIVIGGTFVAVQVAME